MRQRLNQVRVDAVEPRIRYYRDIAVRSRCPGAYPCKRATADAAAVAVAVAGTRWQWQRYIQIRVDVEPCIRSSSSGGGDSNSSSGSNSMSSSAFFSSISSNSQVRSFATLPADDLEVVRVPGVVTLLCNQHKCYIMGPVG